MSNSTISTDSEQAAHASGYAEVKGRLWGNAISNYVRTVVGMSVGLITFRVLYQTLSAESLGFWCLLWSVFGYGILLDFGFGFAAQKRVAELSVSRDWEQLSRVLSTIFCFYAAIAAVVALLVFGFASEIVGWLGVAPAHQGEMKPVMVVFFAAIAIAFPMGIFPEILRGQQRLGLANAILSICMLMRLVLIIAASWYHWSFMSIMLISLGFTLAPDFIAACFALRSMPQVRIRPGLCSALMMRETASFSLFAYIGTATNLILGKSDQVVLGAMLGMGSIALYQAGTKVAEVFAQFTQQVQDTLSPAAAHLHATGNRAALRDLLVQGMRWSALIATPLYLLCAFHLKPLLEVMTGDPALPVATVLVGHVLLLWHFTSILTHSVTKRVFMMSGHERQLMWLGLGEAGLNLGLSLVLIYFMRSVVGAALGSLVATLIFGWGCCWPWAAREAGVGARRLLRLTVVPSLLSCCPLLLVLLLLARLPWLQFGSPWAMLGVHGGLAAAVAVGGVWRWGLTLRERRILGQRFGWLGKLAPGPTALAKPTKGLVVAAKAPKQVKCPKLLRLARRTPPRLAIA